MEAGEPCARSGNVSITLPQLSLPLRVFIRTGGEEIFFFSILQPHPQFKRSTSRARTFMSSSEASSSDYEVGPFAHALPPKRGGKRNAALKPPEGAVLIGGPDDGAGVIGRGEFDWDSVKDDKDVELWLVRVPHSVCLSLLSRFLHTLFFHRSVFNLFLSLHGPLN
jgi:hypothetical protein